VAISFSRPDPSSPAAVADANFPTSRRGFDQQEVREFLRMVAAELARSQERERYLEQELRARRLQAEPSALPAEFDDETAARLLGEETTRILQAARESGTAIRLRAEETAERLLRDAREEAQRLREDAELESSRRRKDAEMAAESELEAAKQQGREMVEEARAYRERALGELARRRDLARQQIDQLIHGRERLVQAFERARLAAADVVDELAPLGELDEYVNLSPTTGPVPVMVPASALGDASSVSDDAFPPTDATQHDGTDLRDRTGSPDEAQPAEPEAVTAPVAATEPAQPARPPEPVGRNATVLQFPVAATSDAAATVDDAVDEIDEIDDDDVTASDVDDLFARLRAQREADDLAPEDQTAPAAEAEGGVDAEAETPVDAPATPFERRDEALTPLIVAAARKLKRVLADEQNSALDSLRRGPVSALDQLVSSEDDHVSRYFDALLPAAVAAAEAGAASVAAALDLHLVPSDTAVDVPLDAVRVTLAGELIRPLRDRLAERIHDEAGDNEAITRSARAIYREWKTKHIDDHLDDLLRLAYGRGMLAAYPPATPCAWVADPAVGACSDCEDNSLQGGVAPGQAFPTGHVTPPAHPGCRCLVLPG
jgi:DivIVA domain-containing protein